MSYLGRKLLVIWPFVTDISKMAWMPSCFRNTICIINFNSWLPRTPIRVRVECVLFCFRDRSTRVVWLPPGGAKLAVHASGHDGSTAAASKRTERFQESDKGRHIPDGFQGKRLQMLCFAWARYDSPSRKEMTGNRLLSQSRFPLTLAM